MTAIDEKIGYVVIGRNEGDRLKECLSSLPPAKGCVVYVDSGSTDGSAGAARGLGAEVVELSTDRPFTAARARNEGVERLAEIAPGAEFVMLVDGDSVLFEGWSREGAEFLAAHPDMAAVAGRVRERHPDASLYNRLCEIEWAAPAGESIACGGIAMMRIAPVREAGGFNASLGGGEEPELCLRLRERGWKIWRLGSDMAEHDAAITSFRQWFRRMARGGRAFAEVSDLHRDSPARIWSREAKRALVWASILPAGLIAGFFIHPAGFLLLTAYPLQIVRLATFGRSALPPAARDHAWLYAAFMTLAKFAEAKGVVSYWLSRGRN